MILYILFYFIIFCFLINYNRSFKLKYFNYCYSLVFLFSAFRFDVGYDFPLYYGWIKGDYKFIEDQLNRLEFLSRSLVVFSHDIGFYQLFFIITSFIIIYLTYRSIKEYSSDYVISTLVFLSFPIFFFNSLSIIRQYVALSIVFYSFKYIRSRVLFKFLSCIFIAFLFHKSAIVAIILYWVYNIKFKNVHFLIIYISGFFSSQLIYILVKSLFPYYLPYLDQNIGVGGDKILLAFQVIGLFILFFVDKKQNDYNYRFYLNTFFIGLFIWSSLAPYGHAGFRGALYFMVFFILLFPEIIILVKERKVLKPMVYLLCFCFFVFTLIMGKLNPHKDPNIPYRVFFLTDKSDFESVKE
ncbi:EpsG family protein [Aestuariibaculum sediminum]|uniref:EpsG family protein n=1 Tax=Aestuariibaculum sediminum TaxID=2770637 RepID=A0A8J6U708_9FLAO|nr:EpsG family protein [Aestuariibaculum sediminum]MBD0831210.1 EpsG family protein [Aestuariibaculum sediminum]